LVNALCTVRYYLAFQRHPMASRESVDAWQVEQLQEPIAFALLLDAGADIAALVIRGTVKDGGEHHRTVLHVIQRI
jgi:hypothetical protein